MNGYNFTERVRTCLALSREEAVRLQHAYIGTEHILLGIIAEGEGVAATAMHNLGVNFDDLRSLVERTVKPGSTTPTGPDLPYTSRAKRVLELAMAEARHISLGHNYVGTEHLLLGLLREEAGIGARTLVEAGVTLDDARQEILRILGTEIPLGAQFPPPKSMRSSWTPPLPQVTARVKEVLAAARHLSPQFNAVTPLMIAVALLRQSDGAMRAVLDHVGLNIDRALDHLGPELEHEITATDDSTVEERAAAVRGVLVRANQECHLTGDEVCGTGHLLVALAETVPKVAEALLNQGISPDDVRKTFKRLSG